MSHPLNPFAIRVTLTLSAILLASCAMPAPPPRITTPATDSFSNWHAGAVAQLNVVPLPPIPAMGSAQLKRELADIRALQSVVNDDARQHIPDWDAGAVTRWNGIARDAVAAHKMSPPLASRAYALLSVAQEIAIRQAGQLQLRFKRAAPDKLDPVIQFIGTKRTAYACPSLDAAIAVASSKVLSTLFPDQAPAFQAWAQAHMTSRLIAGANVQSDLDAGAAIGKAAAAIVLARARNDGSEAAWQGKLPTGDGVWSSALKQKPLLPLWSQVQPWHLSSPDQFRPPPPPAFGSREFMAAVEEVRHFSDHRTAEQLRIAKLWADGAGTATPPGHWNDIAIDLIDKHGMDDAQAAQVLSLMNTAVMDAGIACWEAKYHYMLLRPSQADSAITLPIGLPNFPSYVSGHAAFSGAASEVLAHFFPDEAARLRAMAEEAALSRVYGGIHYRFDGEQGLKLGRAVAAWALASAEAIKSQS